MKEIKNIQLKVRISPKEKELVMNYCEKHDISVSDFLRNGINRILEEENRNDNCG